MCNGEISCVGVMICERITGSCLCLSSALSRRSPRGNKSTNEDSLSVCIWLNCTRCVGRSWSPSRHEQYHSRLRSCNGSHYFAETYSWIHEFSVGSGLINFEEMHVYFCPHVASRKALVESELNFVYTEETDFSPYYHSVQKFLPSCLLSKNIKIRIHRTIILPVVLYGCET
jgi:hypothetical protein